MTSAPSPLSPFPLTDPLPLSSNDFDPLEPTVDDEEPLPEEDPTTPYGDATTPLPNGHNAAANSSSFNNVVEMNADGNGPAMGQDPSAQAQQQQQQQAKKNTVLGLKEKRIPNEARNTTPYMTKYERARVLGTRALQIR